MTKARSNATAEAAKGDLRVGTGTNTSGILSAGNNGESLVLDSSTSTGLRWTGTPSASNPLINSAFDVWQRGTSFAVPTNYTTYTADRYVAYRGGLNSGATISRQATNDTTNLPFIRYCLRYQRDSGNSQTGDLTLLSSMETSDSIRYAGRTVTFSFYARAGANYSPTSSALVIRLDSGTGTDQAINTGFTGQTAVISQTATLTTTWQRFTYTGTVGATATQLGFYALATPTGTAGAADYFEITGFQIDIGSVALPYRRNAGTLQGELAACQRYYVRILGDNANTYFGWGQAFNSTTFVAAVPLPVTMRTASLTIDYSGGFVYAGNTNYTVTAMVLNQKTGKQTAGIDASVASGLTANDSYSLTASSTSSYVGLSAEL